MAQYDREKTHISNTGRMILLILKASSPRYFSKYRYCTNFLNLGFTPTLTVSPRPWINLEITVDSHDSFLNLNAPRNRGVS